MQEMLFPIKRGRSERIIQEVIWFDRYLVLSEIGRGSGSIVYLVRHQKLGEYRAVKCISKKSDFAWQIREAAILNHLKHPQIPVIYDVEEDEESYYIIEEYVEGESLEAVMLQSSFITLNFIYHTILGVANVLSYLHHLKPKPVIYQDLKAEHVIISKDGIKLIDFGIASYLGETGNKFQNYGTPEFSAPEKQNQAKVSIRTDVYSIGKLLEELISAEGKRESQCLMHIAKKAMHPQEEERYASVEEFRADMIRHMQSKQNPVYQKHLLRKIIVAGSQPHIGTTHVAVSLTEYLNQQNMSAVYQEKNSYQDMRMTIRTGGFAEECGLYRRGDFLGMPQYGTGVKVQTEDVIEVMDYGDNLTQALPEEADLFLFIAGSRKWEIRHTDRAYERLKDRKGLVVISNYGDRHQAKEYAREYGRTIYSFPLDPNPFYMTKEKEKLFKGLLAKEGGEVEGEQNYWYCRKYPGKWGYTFICGIGKLCSKWFGRKDRLC